MKENEKPLSAEEAKVEERIWSFLSLYGIEKKDKRIVPLDETKAGFMIFIDLCKYIAEQCAEKDKQLADNDIVIKDLLDTIKAKDKEAYKYQELYEDFSSEVDELQLERRNLEAKYEALKQKADKLYTACALPNPWPIHDVLKCLSDAADKLLHRYNYDGAKHEEILICVNRGNELSNDILEAITNYEEQE